MNAIQYLKSAKTMLELETFSELYEIHFIPYFTKS